MPEYINLLDLVKRSGNDLAVGLIEDSFGVAPELELFPVRTVRGSSYNVGRRTALPSGGFRDLNEGRTAEKSTYARDLKPLLIFDLQLAMDAKAPAIEDRSVGDVLTDEATGAFRGGMRTIGRQFYYGTDADAKGFQGIRAQMGSGDDLAKRQIAAGGSDGSSAYLVWPGIQGVHFVVSEMAPFMISEWSRQLIRNASNEQIWVLAAEISALIGLSVGSDMSIFRVSGIRDNNTSHYLTDKLGARLRAKVPVERRAGLRWMMNPTVYSTLQESRSAVGQVASGASGEGASAPLPTMLAGYPITETNSIAVNETTLV